MDQVKILGHWGDIVAVHKPAGWLTIPGRGNKENIPILSHVLGKQLRKAGLIKKTQSAGEPDLFVVHRLDEHTSGVILFALSADSHRKLSQAFEGSEIKKTYWTVIQGQLKANIVDAPLFKLPSKKNKSVVNFEKGKPSKTLLRSLHSSQGFSVVEAKPVTGRSHQIRVHLAHIGNPIVGDKLYGGPDVCLGFAVPRPLLHAREIQFILPKSSQSISASSEVEGVFKEVMLKLGINVNGNFC